MNMKLFPLLFSAVVFSILIAACKKEEVDIILDEIPPVITLIGAADITVPLYDTYTEPGATAIDDIDGNISTLIAIAGSVDTDMVGDYTLEYSVCDEANNKSSVIRTVHVVITADNYPGSFDMTSDCTGIYGLNTACTVTVDEPNSALTFVEFIDYGLGTFDLLGTFSGQDITIPNQDFTLFTIEGDGDLSNDANVITLNSTFTPLFGTAESCTVTLTRP